MLAFRPVCFIIFTPGSALTNKNELSFSRANLQVKSIIVIVAQTGWGQEDNRHKAHEAVLMPFSRKIYKVIFRHSVNLSVVAGIL